MSKVFAEYLCIYGKPLRAKTDKILNQKFTYHILTDNVFDYEKMAKYCNIIPIPYLLVMV